MRKGPPGPNEGSQPLDKETARRRIANFLEKSPFNLAGVSTELLEPFQIGEVVIPAGRAGGSSIVVDSSYSGKYLVYKD